MPPGDRQSALLEWALHSLGEPADTAATATAVAGDASSRRYFRLPVAKRCYILVDAPPATEKNAEFIAVRELLANAGVRVPAVLEHDLERGFLLLEDFGDQLLLPMLQQPGADARYQGAFELLLKLSAIDVARAAVPAYDAAVLLEELGRFATWFMEGLLGYTISREESELLEALSHLLVESALAQPQVLVHRDFHSRNIMLLEDGSLGVIDFQDALVGPYTYDLVSLLRDCYVEWPDAKVQQWALDYRRRLVDAGHLALPGERDFLRQFDLMGLQRHIKVLGTFARLHLRDGKDAYLQDLPRVLRYTQAMLARHAAHEPVIAAAQGWFERSVLPLASQRHGSGAP